MFEKDCGDIYISIDICNKGIQRTLKHHESFKINVNIYSDPKNKTQNDQACNGARPKTRRSRHNTGIAHVIGSAEASGPSYLTRVPFQDEATIRLPATKEHAPKVGPASG